MNLTLLIAAGWALSQGLGIIGGGLLAFTFIAVAQDLRRRQRPTNWSDAPEPLAMLPRRPMELRDPDDEDA